jgi:transmembrane sensor
MSKGLPTMPPPQDLHQVAAGWFAKQRSGDMSGEDRIELRRWLASDPEHVAAYSDVRRGWGSAGSVRSDPRVMAMRERWDAIDDRPPRWRSRWAIAASLVVALTIAGALGWRDWPGSQRIGDQVYRTALGEQRTIELADGSVVTLNTASVLRTRRDGERRLLYLDEGQAFFRVAKDPDRPFVVTAAGRTVTALGTAFDIQVDQGEFKVTLVEGKVRVEAVVAARPPVDSTRVLQPRAQSPVVQATEMVAGTQLVAPANEDWRIVRPNILAETSWTKGRLLFHRERLADVVEELNRYSEQKITLRDPKLADVPISGSFKPGDVASFVAAMEDYRMARRGLETDRQVELLTY